MTAKPENLGHFIFNSDFPTDKIVWLYEGQLTTDSNGQGELYIWEDKFPYNSPPAFVKGVGSVDNWQSSFMLGSKYPFAGDIYDSTSLDFGRYWNSEKQAYAPALNVYVSLRNYANKTVKLRLWGVQREDIAVAQDQGNTSNISKSKVKFDSSYNYPRLYMEGIAKSGETITHGLKKIPYIEYWYNLGYNNLDRSWSYKAQGSFVNNDSWVAVRATTDTITFTKRDNGGTLQDVYYYYRLYA